MKRTTNLILFSISLLLFSVVNFYFSNLIALKLIDGKTYSLGLVDLIYVKNTGAAFSILQNATTFLIIISTLAVFLIAYYLFKNLRDDYMKENLFLALMLSGILGNLYERLAFGYVRDFFSLTFVNFPIFNISDIFINVGVFGIIILILLMKKPIKL